MTTLTIPQSKLGEVSALTITSPDLESSFRFYQQLGFTEVMRMDFPFHWIQITDGALLIMLREDDNPYLALTYYVKDMAKTVSEIEEQGLDFIQRPKPSDFIQRYLLQSPDKLNISLVSVPDNGFQQPPGPTMLTMPQQDYFNPDKYVNKVCGMFGELAHPVTDLDASVAFWEKLGFAVLSKFESPYKWAILSDGLAVVGLHQANHFNYPAITFFAADMAAKVQSLKDKGIIDDESTGNVVITTPEGQHVNLFKLGM
jgi:predicted lactoylglutathione lyase